MYRQLITALVAPLIAVACSKSEASTAPAGEQIAFRSEVASRAIITTEADMRAVGIGVFGTVAYGGGSTSDVIFDNEHLMYDTAKGWYYADPVRRWIPASLYKFVAIYPYAATDAACYTFDAAAATLTAADYEAGNANIDNDLMYAAHERDLALTANRDAVPLVMHHACAAVQFRIINGSGSTITALDGIALTGVQYKGTLSVASTDTAAWTLSDERVASDDITTYGGTFDMPEGGFEDNIRNPLPLYNKDIITVLPQILRGQSITLRLCTNGATTPHTVDLSEHTDKWEAGKKYVYTLTLTNDTIAFDVTVRDWIEDYIDLN